MNNNTRSWLFFLIRLFFLICVLSYESYMFLPYKMVEDDSLKLRVPWKLKTGIWKDWRFLRALLWALTNFADIVPILFWTKSERAKGSSTSYVHETLWKTNRENTLNTENFVQRICATFFLRDFFQPEKLKRKTTFEWGMNERLES